MDRQFIFTFLKKYSVISIILVIFLTGCQGDTSAAGFFSFENPFSQLIKYIAILFGGDYGLSIIVLTLLIRLLLMPLSLKQTKSAAKTKEKMSEMKPDMDAITDKYKDKKDAESKAEMQKEMMQLYQKHQFNPLSSLGCLPMLIQFPIIIAVYYAIRNSPEIAAHSFLWFDLGQVDLILPFVAAAIYFIQSRVSLTGMDEKQRKQMAVMSLLSPVMIGFISFNAPAALPLYWTVSGLFLVLQTLLAKRLYYPKIQH
ncbi:membrane protein insertase YidC [Agaribacter marinus]|uniref:Membrane protein insertase YidC n=1 Tax=Virgibacillus salarius TaxID=447199 RepID=A0A941DPV9_9BACI|nr:MULTISPECIES: membrane protein insertase YidC [Bacillaceae]MBR7794739.1 membrane protein insertase YidC [Virgibacillus salarius]NAZ07459.1 membrane protein insertase YidC [Agaribacter marinus]WBX80992.1 membrane protein insertase YidC [Virgibacillus salarius]